MRPGVGGDRRSLREHKILELKRIRELATALIEAVKEFPGLLGGLRVVRAVFGVVRAIVANQQSGVGGT